MNPYKYAIHPGYVIASDGDKHFIGYRQLINLYGVNPAECFEWNDSARLGKRWEDYIHLHPSESGNYNLPKADEEI
jgi:hypothetical protein